MAALFGLLSGLLPLAGTYPYVRDILGHKTKPHRASFLIWTVLGAIAFFSQLAKGATWSLLLPVADTVAVAVIFMLSLWHGVGGYSKKDKSALVLAGLGLVLWYFTKQPLTALLISIGVDMIGTTLTIVKTHKEPHTETFSSWLLSSLGGLFAILAIGSLSFGLLIYPLYIFLANGTVATIILLDKGKKGPGSFPDKPLV